jgi:hypothetical protein
VLSLSFLARKFLTVRSRFNSLVSQNPTRRPKVLAEVRASLVVRVPDAADNLDEDVAVHADVGDAAAML